MTEPMLSIGPELLRRLQAEEIIWFTSVSPTGAPAPNPVWFLWDDGCIVVYSEPTSYRVRNLKQNPRVALTLQGVDGLGHNVVIISGEAELHPGNTRIPPAYWKKYKHLLQNMSPDEMTASYNVEIRVKPRRIRTE